MIEDDAVPSIGKLLTILHWQTRIFVERQLSSLNLTWGEFHILMRLCYKGQMKQRDITEELHISKGTTSKMVQKLETDGYIRRERDKHDGRIYIIHVTPKAHDMQIKLSDISARWHHILLDGLTLDKQQTILAELNTMIHQALRANKEAQDA